MTRWLTHVLLYWLEKLEVFHKETCLAYGGTMMDGVRLCGKLRWHTDSHRYEWADTSGRFHDQDS